MNSYSFNIDFDGTVVTHAYPDIGKDIGAISVLKKLTDAGHKLILFTMRDGQQLLEAVNWFERNEIPLYGVQTNSTQKRWTGSPKSYANFIIDDSSLFAPLAYHEDMSHRPHVDWEVVEAKLIERGLIS